MAFWTAQAGQLRCAVSGQTLRETGLLLPPLEEKHYRSAARLLRVQRLNMECERSMEYNWPSRLISIRLPGFPY
jgi:hypothetical protein